MNDFLLREFKYDKNDNVAAKWASYSYYVKNSLAITNFNNDKKKALLLACIGEEASNIYRLQENQQDSVDQVLAKLKAHYQPLTNKFIYIRQFNQMKQETDESIDKFLSRLKLVASNCGFDNQLDSQLLQKLICECKNDKVLEKIYNATTDVNLNQFIAWMREEQTKNELKQNTSQPMPNTSNYLNLNAIKN